MEVKKLIDLILPLECVSCGQDGSLLCNLCLARIIPPNFHCPFCKTTTTGGLPCRLHQEARLESVIAAASYRDPALRAALAAWKYSSVGLGKTLTNVLVNAAVRFRSLLPAEALIVPIPLLWHREKKRGGNQSAVLAEAVATALDLSLVSILGRRYTYWDLLITKHADLAHHDPVRWFSLRRAFYLKEPTVVMDKNIILVDDVATSGANLEMAARLLHAAGAKRIVGLVLARA